MCNEQRCGVAVSCNMSRNRERVCCDGNNCCRYNASCRNAFWPEFAHPRWLSCADLYDGNNTSCVEETSDCGCE